MYNTLGATHQKAKYIMLNEMVDTTIISALTEVEEHLKQLQNPGRDKIRKVFHVSITKAYREVKTHIYAISRELPYQEKKDNLMRAHKRLYRQLSLKFNSNRLQESNESFATELNKLINQYSHLALDRAQIYCIPQQILEDCRNSFSEDHLLGNTIKIEAFFNKYSDAFESWVNEYGRYHILIDRTISIVHGVLNIGVFFVVIGVVLVAAMLQNIFRHINALVLNGLNLVTLGEYLRQLHAEVTEEKIIQIIHDKMSLMGIDSEGNDDSVIANFVKIKNDQLFIDARENENNDFYELSDEEMDNNIRAQLERSQQLLTEESLREQVGQEIMLKITGFVRLYLSFKALYLQLTIPYPEGVFNQSASFLLRVAQGSAGLDLLFIGTMLESAQYILSVIYSNTFYAGVALNCGFMGIAILPLCIYDACSSLVIQEPVEPVTQPPVNEVRRFTSFSSVSPWQAASVPSVMTASNDSNSNEDIEVGTSSRRHKPTDKPRHKSRKMSPAEARAKAQRLQQEIYPDEADDVNDERTSSGPHFFNKVSPAVAAQLYFDEENDDIEAETSSRRHKPTDKPLHKSRPHQFNTNSAAARANVQRLQQGIYLDEADEVNDSDEDKNVFSSSCDAC